MRKKNACDLCHFLLVKIVIAHHPYEASRDDEISFEKDEVIKVTDDTDPDWWVGKKKDGSLGFFPSNVRTGHYFVYPMFD